MKSNNVVIATVLFLFLMFVASNGNNIKSYGQLLDKSYVNENCGVSINYPSDWKLEEKIQNDAKLPVNYIVEFQPNNEEDSMTIVGIELHDISHLPDRTLESIKTSEENNITMGGTGIIETSEPISIAGYDAQKIVYTVTGENNDRLKKMEIDVLAYNREYKITFDTSGTSLYQKYISTVEEMIRTFKINEPTFEEIAC
ncbi:MAG: PsbP-related protein [Nitrososphaeraceae archaeon]|nr:PsbP-related protein [Nitrososphaeraceae archaeon]MDW0135975.1 PsbP-related protein [Nitrososphaeraceae archaeon]